MEVKAIKLGYYDHKRRRVGSVFELKDAKDFSEKWMIKVPPGTASDIPEPEQPREPAALSSGASAALHTGKIEKPGVNVENETLTTKIEETQPDVEEVI